MMVPSWWTPTGPYVTCGWESRRANALSAAVCGSCSDTVQDGNGLAGMVQRIWRPNLPLLCCIAVMASGLPEWIQFVIKEGGILMAFTGSWDGSPNGPMVRFSPWRKPALTKQPGEETEESSSDDAA